MQSVFGDNKLKLGTFSSNLDGGFTATTVPERFNLTWDNVSEVARMADEGGLEAQVPLARWIGLGGKTNYMGKNYETITWATGLGAQTKHSNVFATVHVPTIHPIVAAKQCTTADHVSHGRFALNVVCGWSPPEFAMFNMPLREHDAGYDYAGEWIEVVRKLWTEEGPFDYEGKYLKITKGVSWPKPVRKPHPPIMSAGQSPVGARFAAKNADMAFQGITESTIDETRAKFAELRRIGREDYGRTFEIWSGCWVICRPTEKEARDFYRYAISENGDYDAVANMPPALFPENAPPEVAREARARFLAGMGGGHIIGTPEQIAEKLKAYSDIGIDGMLFSWVDYHDGVRSLVNEIIPLLEQMGLRKPFRKKA